MSGGIDEWIENLRVRQIWMAIGKYTTCVEIRHAAEMHSKFLETINNIFIWFWPPANTLQLRPPNPNPLIKVTWSPTFCKLKIANLGLFTILGRENIELLVISIKVWNHSPVSILESVVLDTRCFQQVLPYFLSLILC